MKIPANLILAAGAGMALCGAASAGVVLTFGFTELNGTYVAADANSGLFTATAVNTADLMSEGDVTRLLPPGDGTATYDHGFLGSAFGGQANVAFSITRTGTTGAGTFTVTDIDGDTITGTLSGEWIALGGATFFNGVIGGQFVSTGGDNAFNGASLSPTSFTPVIGTLDGGVTILFTNSNSTFFGGDFTGVSVLTSANFVPTPGSAMLLALGGLAASRRKR